MTDDPAWLKLSEEVEDARRDGRPVVALESTVLAHGLPRPRNLEVGRAMEAEVRRSGAVPATIAVISGVILVGLDDDQLVRIATDDSVHKLSTRDLPLSVARRDTGATTVAATAHLAARAGIEVLSTGGIGGVHRGTPPDVSADLTELQRTRIVVVCAGAKSILDLAATRELLETLGVLVLGWRTDRFPAFYAVESGESVDARVDTATEMAEIWREHGRLQSPGAVLLCAPVPSEMALAPERVDDAINGALQALSARDIRGKSVTPHLLAMIAEATHGASLEANVALLENNARIAAGVAVALREG